MAAPIDCRNYGVIYLEAQHEIAGEWEQARIKSLWDLWLETREIIIYALAKTHDDWGLGGGFLDIFLEWEVELLRKLEGADRDQARPGSVQATFEYVALESQVLQEARHVSETDARMRQTLVDIFLALGKFESTALAYRNDLSQSDGEWAQTPFWTWWVPAKRAALAKLEKLGVTYGVGGTASRIIETGIHKVEECIKESRYPISGTLSARGTLIRIDENVQKSIVRAKEMGEAVGAVCVQTYAEVMHILDAFFTSCDKAGSISDLLQTGPNAYMSSVRTGAQYRDKYSSLYAPASVPPPTEEEKRGDYQRVLRQLRHHQ